MPRGRSLHIGLDRVDPDRYDGWDGALASCEHDARDMEAIAAAQGLEPTLLLNEEATAEAVSSAITAAASDLGRGDLFVLTYAGHGSYVRDRDGDEPEGYDETWVLYDRQLVDDELYALWGEFAAGCRILVVSDSCHSGSVAREVPTFLIPDGVELDPVDGPFGQTRGMPSRVAEVVVDRDRDLYDEIQRRLPPRADIRIGAHVLQLSACQDNQTALDGERNGLFTAALRAVWDDGRYDGGYEDFWRAIEERMPGYQRPNWMTVGRSSSAFTRSRPFTV